MAEWATLKGNQGLLRGRLSLETALFPFIFGVLLARGNLLGSYPFGIGFGAAWIMMGNKGVRFALLGIILGVATTGQVNLLAQTVLVLAVLGLYLPQVRKRRWRGIGLTAGTGIVSGTVTAAVTLFMNPMQFSVITVGLQVFLAGTVAAVSWFALDHQEAVLRGEFTREQGMAWILLLVGAISGLQGLEIGQVNMMVVLISFFVLFVSERYGAGAAAGVGALLGFLPQLNLAGQSLLNSGMYSLAGFCTGGFQRFGRLGMGAAFASVTMLLTLFLRQEAVYSQIISSGLGLLLFMVWPGPAPRKDYLKPKMVPEVETAVSKVKAVAEMFDQIAFGYQSADVQASEARTQIPELMNVLVDKVCHACPTREVCWEREFYQSYRFLFDLLALMESNPDVRIQDLPIEWKRHCGKLKEMHLSVQFVLEKERQDEVWRQRLVQKQEAIASQFQGVSQVIGHLAKEMHARHNKLQVRPSGLARRRRHFLDVGVASFCKTGNTICGDNYASLAFAPTQHAFILCDGMGAGDAAAGMSAAALKLLEQLLNTGFEPEGAVQALNSILVLRSPEESFVTVDMAIIDLESDQLHLVKVGAAPSYLISPESVQILAASGLPAGILNHIDIPVLTKKFEDEQALILVTDGIQDVGQNGEDWLQEYLGQVERGSSQELADTIVRQARLLRQENMQDDGVVLVIRKNFGNE